MALIDLRQLNQTVANKQVAPFYLFFGEEFYLVQEALRRVQALALGSGLPEFNYDVFYATDLNVTQFRDTVETLPMMAERRVVVVKEVHQLKAKELEDLISLLENPIDTCTVIFVGEKIDQRKKFFKKLIDAGSAVEFQRLPEDQVPAWIQHMAEKYEKAITKEAVREVQDRVGTSLTEIHSEMQKLAQYLGERKRIELKDVQDIVSRHRVESVFDLTSAIGQNDRAEALNCLAKLLDQGEEALGVLALISRHIRILLMVQDGLRSGLSSYQLSSRVGVPPFYLKDYVAQSKRWPRNKLVDTHSSLLDTDKALKSSPVASHIWLENFILKSCSH